MKTYRNSREAGPLRHWIRVCFIVIASLLSGYYSLYINPPSILIQADGVARWEERMQPVREFLPASVREVGYISDSEQSSRVQEYILTKYALAPVVVQDGIGFEWVVANFIQPGFEDILGAQIPSDYTIKKFGAGIYLIHRTPP